MIFINNLQRTVLAALLLSYIGIAPILSNKLEAAPVTQTFPMVDGNVGVGAVVGYGPSDNGMTGATGQAPGWELDFDQNNPPEWLGEAAPGAYAHVQIPDCVTSDIDLHFSFSYEQFDDKTLGATQNTQVFGAIFGFGVENEMLYDYDESSASLLPLSGTIDLSTTITRAEYDSQNIIMITGLDLGGESHWSIYNLVATATYDDNDQGCGVEVEEEDDNGTDNGQETNNTEQPIDNNQVDAGTLEQVRILPSASFDYNIWFALISTAILIGLVGLRRYSRS
ncbi:hypothetical protein KA531_02120 [Candidatus Saccharibacteria bacterium]|nr:hypothetical protein [Candidatus Saccharibacteria bacterium]